MLAAVFVHSTAEAVLHELATSVASNANGISSSPTWTTTEVLTQADLYAAEFILQRVANVDPRSDTFLKLVQQADQRFTQVSNLDVDPPYGLGLGPILATAAHAGVLWAMGQRENAIVSLEEAFKRSIEVARGMRIDYVEVDEDVSVEVNNPMGDVRLSQRGPFKVARTVRWHYRGPRPTAGSAARLAQDILFCEFVARGEHPSAAEVYKRSLNFVESNT